MTQHRSGAGSSRTDSWVEPGGYDEVVLRGDPASGQFLAFWLSGGRVLAGMNVNVWDVASDIETLVRSTAVVDTDQLRDPGVRLPGLVGEPASPA